MDMNNTTSDKNVAQDIEFLKSNEADALYFRGNPKLKSAVESVLERNKELEEVIENSIPKQKVKDLKESIILPNTIVGGRRNGKTLEYGIKLGKIKAYEELLEGGK